MKIILQVLLFFISIQISAQDKKSHFQQYQAIDYMLLFNANSDKESYYDANTGQMEEPSKFIIGGLAS